MEENKVVHEVVEETYRELFVKYEKALDKACDMLNVYDLAYLPKEKQKTDEQWKEWALKDE